MYNGEEERYDSHSRNAGPVKSKKKSYRTQALGLSKRSLYNILNQVIISFPQFNTLYSTITSITSVTPPNNYVVGSQETFLILLLGVRLYKNL